jgi:hypothetical protein
MKPLTQNTGKAGRKKKVSAAAPSRSAAAAQTPERVLPKSTSATAEDPAAQSDLGAIPNLHVLNSEKGQLKETMIQPFGIAAQRDVPPLNERPRYPPPPPLAAAVSLFETAAGPNSGRFQKGQSGNPLGRPKGSRNKGNLVAQEMLDAEAPNIIRTAIDGALVANPMMLKLCVERLLPVRKERAVPLELPKIERSQDVPAASSAIVAAMGEGILSVIEAKMHLEVLEMHKRTLEMAEHKKRLEEMEDDDL